MKNENEKIKNGLFLQLWFAAIDNGLVGEIGPTNWQTLTVLARYIDKNGYCYPSEKTLAYHLKITESGAKKRISNLKKARYKGFSVITVENQKRVIDKDRKFKWAKNEYKLSPAVLKVFSIFREKVELSEDKELSTDRISPKEAKKRITEDTTSAYGKSIHKLQLKNNYILTTQCVYKKRPLTTKEKELLRELVDWANCQNRPPENPQRLMENTIRKYGYDEVLKAKLEHGQDAYNSFEHFWQHLKGEEN